MFRAEHLTHPIANQGVLPIGITIGEVAKCSANGWPFRQVISRNSQSRWLGKMEIILVIFKFTGSKWNRRTAESWSCIDNQHRPAMAAVTSGHCLRDACKILIELGESGSRGPIIIDLQMEFLTTFLLLRIPLERARIVYTQNSRLPGWLLRQSYPPPMGQIPCGFKLFSYVARR